MNISSPNHYKTNHILGLILCCNCQPELKLEQGIVRGKIKQSYKGRNFMAFEGIPYAEAPVGDLRFAVSKYHSQI